MTKQEVDKRREGIYKIIIDQDCYTDIQRLKWEKGVPDKILKYLHDNDKEGRVGNSGGN